MHANDHFVNRGSSASPLTRRQILRGVVATASAANLPGGRVFATGYAAKLSVDHSAFSVSTGSMLAARRAGT